MKADDFDLRKTGRFKTMPEDEPPESSEENTQKRARPSSSPKADPQGSPEAGSKDASEKQRRPQPGSPAETKKDPHFDRRKTQVFLRPVLLPGEESPKEPPGSETSDDEEPTTGEFARSGPRRSKPKKNK